MTSGIVDWKSLLKIILVFSEWDHLFHGFLDFQGISFERFRVPTLIFPKNGCLVSKVPQRTPSMWFKPWALSIPDHWSSTSNRTTPPKTSTSRVKINGRCISDWNSPFLGAMLVLRGIIIQKQMFLGTMNTFHDVGCRHNFPSMLVSSLKNQRWPTKKTTRLN